MARPENATALVTGASKGIGAAIAKALAEDGWHVAVNYRSDEDGAKATVKAIEDAGGKAAAFHADVTNGTPDELFKQVEEELGPVIALVNNAGVTADGLAIQLDDEAWDKVIGTNLTAAFRLTRRAMRPMIKARYGRIVNVASVVGPARQRGPVQLRRGQGRPDRHDQDRRRRGRAARRDRQRGRTRLHRDRNDQGRT